MAASQGYAKTEILMSVMSCTTFVLDVSNRCNCKLVHQASQVFAEYLLLIDTCKVLICHMHSSRVQQSHYNTLDRAAQAR